MDAERMVCGDGTIPSKERAVIEQPLLPAVVTRVADRANPAG
jgi:hypothetical protein